jgi:hypothetical protein
VRAPLSLSAVAHYSPPAAVEELSSNSSDYAANSWVTWFLGTKGNEYFCEVDEDYILDRFNLTGLNTEVQHYPAALDLVTDALGECEGGVEMVNGEERSVRVRGKAAGDDREREREREGERERKIFFLPCLSLLPPFGSCLPFASASLLSLGTAARDNREKGRRCLSLFRSLSPLPRSSRSSASFRPCLVPLALRCVLPLIDAPPRFASPWPRHSPSLSSVLTPALSQRTS